MTEDSFHTRQFFNDIAELPNHEKRERIEEREQQITAELQAVNIEIDIAKFKLRRGDNIDLDWMRKASIARSIKSKQVQALQRELGRIPKGKPPEIKYISDYFVDVARERLPIEVFNDFLGLAQARKSAN